MPNHFLQFNANLLDVVPTRLESVQADVLDGVLEVAKDLHAIFSICNHGYWRDRYWRPQSRQDPVDAIDSLHG